ncbi:MAG: hypothetical protein WAW60_01045 [Candidatus Saccharimonadales bacterium]
MYRGVMRIWNNPTARRIIIWAWPFVLAWITKKMNQKTDKMVAKKSSSFKKRS